MSKTSFIMGAVILAVAGCGSSAGTDLCQQTNQCLGGNEKDQAACVAEFEGEAAAAAEYGCTDQWTLLSACHTTKSKCVNDGDHKRYTSENQDTHADACETEQRNYNDCVNGASSLDDH